MNIFDLITITKRDGSFRAMKTLAKSIGIVFSIAICGVHGEKLTLLDVILDKEGCIRCIFSFGEDKIKEIAIPCLPEKLCGYYDGDKLIRFDTEKEAKNYFAV